MAQFNVSPIPVFQVPNTSGTVVNVVNVLPTRAVLDDGEGDDRAGGEGEARDNFPEGSPVNRRDVERRSGEERRRQQVAVLLDTRVGERRKIQRRVEDPPPPAVDFKV